MMAGLKGPSVDLERRKTPEPPIPAAVNGLGYTSVEAEDSDRRTNLLNVTSDVLPTAYQSLGPNPMDRDANAPQLYTPPQSEPLIPPATTYYRSKTPHYNKQSDYDIESRFPQKQRNIAYTNNDYGQDGGPRRKTESGTCKKALIVLGIVHIIVAIIVIAVRVTTANGR
ncbi:hypothetical protein HYFRA_00008231 [Hymenoscyphus fraxineus]|uniref:Uncharacterized protein n=1 Tax=Hymenoscyphus fraxineus TaxID=746836 RepID=A0A9N9L8L4_9HELO|nr:hypothetical protein HYFRA_00008231 [Hymenoscyphus fraxineus]